MMLLDKLLQNLHVRVEPLAICEVGQGWRMVLPAPSDVMLHYVLRGHGAVSTVDGERHELAPSCIAIVPGRMRHSLEFGEQIRHELRVDGAPPEPSLHRLAAGNRSESDFIAICGVVHARYGPSFGLFDHLNRLVVVNLSGVPQVAFALEAILAEQRQPAAASNTLTAALMTQCLVHILRRIMTEGRQRLPWLSALQDAHLAPAIDLMLEDPGRDLSIATLADAAGMSRSTFAQHFALAFDCSPMAFLHRMRMQRAIELLRSSGASIDQVAGRVGFSSRSHFSRAFKRHTGMPPRAYQRSSSLENSGPDA